MLPDTLSSLIATAQEQELYVALIQQLNKDFVKSNIATRFPISLQPVVLYNKLSILLKSLMESDFNDYLNLLYIVDVSEYLIKEQEETKIKDLAYKVALLILQREWQKVWFKYQYS